MRKTVDQDGGEWGMLGVHAFLRSVDGLVGSDQLTRGAIPGAGGGDMVLAGQVDTHA